MEITLEQLLEARDRRYERQLALATPANSVPAAAVIRGVQALSGIIGRKAFVGGKVSQMLKPGAQLRFGI